MTAQPNPQAGAALALVQLLTEHPELPRLRWEVDQYDGTLRGASYGEEHPFEVLRRYADAFGGSIRPEARTYDCGDLRRQRHHLTTRWRDVRLVVSVSVTVGLCGRSHEAGQLAEQQHQLLDAPVPPLAVAA